MLCTDYALLRGAAYMLGLARRGSLRQKPADAKAAGKRNVTDLDAQLLHGDGVPVRMRGKTLEPVAAKPTTAEATDEESETEEAEGEEKPVTLRVVTPADKADAAAAKASTRQDGPENPLRVKNPSDRKKEAAAREREELMRKMNEANPLADPQEYELPTLDLLLAQRERQLRGPGKRSPPQGQDPGKDVRQTSAST